MVLPLSVISGIWVGQQVLQLMAGFSGTVGFASGMEVWAEVFFFVYFLCLLLYVWGTWHAGNIGQKSIKNLIGQELIKISLIGVVGLGVVIPLILTLIMWGGDTNGFLIFLRLACVIAGDLAMRYVIMKSAVYQPLI